MNLFASSEKKARTALSESTSRHALAVANLEAHRLAPADPGNFDLRKAWLTAEIALEQDVEIAAGVVEHWRACVEKFDEEAAKKAAKAENAAEEKYFATTAIKNAEALEASILQTAKLRDIVAADNARAADYNERRGALPYVMDGERRARETPGYSISAEYGEEVVWEDGAGNRPSLFRVNARGEQEPVELGYIRKVRKVCTRRERFVPAEMPQRYERAIALVDRAGRRL